LTDQTDEAWRHEVEDVLKILTDPHYKSVDMEGSFFRCCQCGRLLGYFEKPRKKKSAIKVRCLNCNFQNRVKANG